MYYTAISCVCVHCDDEAVCPLDWVERSISSLTWAASHIS
jgi:hypothetical protein